MTWDLFAGIRGIVDIDIFSTVGFAIGFVLMMVLDVVMG